ncbi:MAG: hypothetical protein ACI9TF_001101 [Paracrocinitomix sp.]|jgi:hypothetical protein
MSMNMLGAETGQLESLAAQLTRTGAEIDQVQSQTQTTADTVVAEMQASFRQALQGIEHSMHHLRGTVDAAHTQLGDTTWTGANAATFHAGYGDFNGAMVSFEGAVGDAYVQFDAQMRTMGETIVAFQIQISSSMQQAHASTDSMQRAVSQQQLNLESAMNTGLSFG